MDQIKKSICRRISCVIQDHLRNLPDPEIFTKRSFAELGEFYYTKIMNDVEDANVDLINVVVSMLGSISTHEEQDKYYEGLCHILGFKLLPQEAYNIACREYNDIFIIRFNSVLQKYEREINQLRIELLRTKTAHDNIERKKASMSIVRDISEDEEELYRLGAACNSLRTRKEMLEYGFNHVKSVLGEFCNLQDSLEIDITLRKTALLISKSENAIVENNPYFEIYKSCLELFEDDIDRNYALFFKVKIYTIIEKSNKRYHETLFTDDDEAVEQYRDYLSGIPKIDDLHCWKTSDAVRYSEALSKLIEEYGLLEVLKELINTSVCLRQRKEILLKTIGQFENGEYEIFNNLISILIEGMFADYLKDTTTFTRFTHMTIYENAVLKDKIRYLEESHCDIYPEATEYFMFYFNNLIRNRVAHGRYYSSSSSLDDEIFSKELIMDLCMLVHMIVRTSETERMYRFIHGYQAYYRRVIRSAEHPLYGALFNDIIGQKTISEYDGIKKYRPIQVAYWLVNPYYEKIYGRLDDKSELLSLRDEFLSKGFWEYVYESLSEIKRQGFDYLNINREFLSVIRALFRCNISSETKQVLGEVNKLANTIIQK